MRIIDGGSWLYESQEQNIWDERFSWDSHRNGNNGWCFNVNKDVNRGDLMRMRIGQILQRSPNSFTFDYCYK